MRQVSGDFVHCPHGWCAKSLNRSDVADRDIETGVAEAVVCRYCGGLFVWRRGIVEHLNIATAICGFIAWAQGQRVIAWRCRDGSLCTMNPPS